MRVGDAAIGALVALLGLVVAWSAWSLPNLPNQAYGAATFPVTIGVCLIGLGAVMTITGITRGDGFSVAVEGWGRQLSSWLRLLAIVVLVTAFVMLADKLGFLIAGSALMFGLLLTFRANVLVAVVVSPIATYVVAWAFGNLLRVPLPRGILSGWW
ncbi:tripartite tricarboxylate transporter TctB family protein [Acuticoccus sp. I52.16.1]|uniref:tripartite tricarboxylate transporter TctB family protein n=1 Tax=Acuticoccus sp. I52.16.1 TaxID=2928472 RepID=UPI001FCF84A2|nr:tripartite tricarboxylate transporter TctB family protein [Acuticoccus sp. I52.16.1]UOM34177.1 tripartite tricarboxylate transporter TctB family protein [Acuticoccus sp. I52.16.1]